MFAFVFAAAAWMTPVLFSMRPKGSEVTTERGILAIIRLLGKHLEQNRRKRKGLYPQLRKKDTTCMITRSPSIFVSGGSADPIERWIPLNHIIKLMICWDIKIE